jgi:hypothetical protein
MVIFFGIFAPFAGRGLAFLFLFLVLLLFLSLTMELARLVEDFELFWSQLLIIIFSQL